MIDNNDVNDKIEKTKQAKELIQTKVPFLLFIFVRKNYRE